MTHQILIVYYSRQGSTQKLAELIARGVHMVDECEAVIRRVSEGNDSPADSHPLVSLEDLKHCDALAIGSPSYFGGPASALKAFIDTTTPLWMNGTLAGKPACAFSSSSSLHGGQENVLLSLLVPLLHHGMLIMGLPYTQAALNETTAGGTPYGPSHVSGHSENPIDSNERKLCLAMGKRLADAAIKLKRPAC